MRLSSVKMEDSVVYTKDIDDKLQREMERLEALKESMNRSNQMTDNMMTILTSFDSRLRKLEDTITPVYQETGNLQRRHENIEKTLASLDHVIGYYHLAEEVEPVITREGPSAGLNNYLSSMEKLQKAVKYFTTNNPGSSEMSHVTTLYEAGHDSLEREFRNLLTRHSKPVSHIVIMDALTADDELPNEKPATIDHLPEKIVEELSQIAAWLQASDPSNVDHMHVYSTIRSTQLLKSLQNLRDHMRSGSKDSANSSLHSPAMSSKFRGQRDTPSKKTIKKAFVKYAPSLMQQSLGKHLESAGLKRQGGSGEGQEGWSDVDIEVYVTSVSALLKLIQSERALMRGIIPDKHQRKIFDLLIQASLDNIMKEGEKIVSSIKASIGRHDHTAVLAIFPIVRHLRWIKPEFDKTLEGCQTPTRSKLATLISSMSQTGARALDEFVDNIRKDADKTSAMPSDGTVHELTSNTMIFLEQLLEFADTAGSMLLTQELLTSKDPDVAKRKLAEFITKVLSSLGLNLNNKAETYGDVTMRAIFMLNNYNYILKSLRRARILDLVHMINPDVESYYAQQIVEHKKSYRESWSRVLHYIMEFSKPMSQQRVDSPAVKLKDKERQAIKDKFTGFNKEIEEICRLQKGYAIADAELRENMRTDNKEFVIPKYQMFLEKYNKVSFTKNPEKYIKYTVNDVQRMLNRFFDSTA